MKTRDRLRIAAQKSGRLSDAGRDLLTRCGLRFRESRDRLFCYGESEPVDHDEQEGSVHRGAWLLS